MPYSRGGRAEPKPAGSLYERGLLIDPVIKYKSIKGDIPLVCPRSNAKMEFEGFCVRVQAMDGYAEKMRMLAQVSDYLAIVAVKHRGSTGENEALPYGGEDAG